MLSDQLSPVVELSQSADSEAARDAYMRREVDGWVELSPTGSIQKYAMDPGNIHSQSLGWVVSRMGASPAKINPQELSRPKSSYVDFLVPGLLAMTVLTTSLFGIGMTLVANRREGLLVKYRSTPVHPAYFFSSYYLGRITIFALELFTLLLGAFLLFKYGSARTILPFFLIGSLGCICFSSISIFLAAKTSNVGAYSGKANLVMLLFLLIGDVFYKVPILPWGLERVISYLPLNTLTQWLRHSAAPELVTSPSFAQVAVLVLITVFFFVLSMKVFRWEAEHT